MGTTQKKTNKKPVSVAAHSRPFYLRKAFLWPTGSLAAIILAIWLAFLLSPWPSTTLIRIVFDKGSRQTTAALQKHAPATPIAVRANQHYIPGNKNALLDVYIPPSASQSGVALPVVVWTHGGAWVSGDKANNHPYFKLLAAQGYVVVSVGYTLAPHKKYPAQLSELNSAHAFIVKNASKYHIDPHKIFLAGDSAGANLSGQMAAIITNPVYARETGVSPVLKPSQLAGTILFCGIYKMEGLTEANPRMPKLISWGDDQVAWAYSGTRSKNGPVIHQMSPYYYVTQDFPATFISGGNGDPLTKKQSQPLSEKLTSLGVTVQTLFYPDNHSPSLPHEYQFNLDNTDGQHAFNRMVDFLRQHTH
jgi:acetyl esterase